MSFLVAVVTRDSTYVLFVLPPLSTPTDLGRVDSGGWDDGILGFSGIPLASPVLLLILLGFIGRLGILGGSRCGSGCGAFRSLGVILPIHRPLRLDLMGGGMGRSILSETAQISLLHVGTWA